ncbi:MAG: RNA methyltransferase [Anaerolineales bacterium]|nr:MAG: RNA methyltransferase [Anaerolineales bacterium]
MTILTSRNNPKIKQVRQLLAHRKEREQTGLFVAEGIRHAGEAVDAGATVEYICYAPDLLNSEFGSRLIQDQSQHGIPCLAVDRDTFSSLAGKDNPQGIMAVVHKPKLSLDDLSELNFPWGVALVAPQDPGNIGAILRTIDAVGASGLLLLDDPEHDQYCTDPYHPSSVRASMGSIFWYPPIIARFSDFTGWAKSHCYSIYGTSVHATADYRQIEPISISLILLMGSEREGLKPSQASICDHMLKIPMQGRVTSLNLAVATGVMLYSILEKKS